MVILACLFALIGCAPHYNPANYTSTYNVISITINSYTQRVIAVCEGKTDDAYIGNVKFEFNSNITVPTVCITNMPDDFTRMVITFKDRIQYKEYVHTENASEAEIKSSQDS